MSMDEHDVRDLIKESKPTDNGEFRPLREGDDMGGFGTVVKARPEVRCLVEVSDIINYVRGQITFAYTRRETVLDIRAAVWDMFTPEQQKELQGWAQQYLLHITVRR